MTAKKRPGRPQKDVERVHLTLPKALMREIRAEAERDGQPLSVKIHRLIERAIAA